MKYSRFEDLPVWKDAIEMKLMIDRFCQHREVARQRNLVAHMDEASLSVSNNIAEGFERGTTNELIYFLYVARGSAGEVRSMLRYNEKQPGLAPIRGQIADLIGKVESISRQLRAWADTLQNSEIRGQRYLTDASRTHFDQTQRAQAFAQRIRAEVQAQFERRQREQRTDAGNAPGRDAGE